MWWCVVVVVWLWWCVVECGNDCGSLQMNVASSPFGTTTSSHMTANSTNHAMVPIVMYVMFEEGEPIVKLGWIVLSDDLKHDYQQVSRWSGGQVEK